MLLSLTQSNQSTSTDALSSPSYLNQFTITNSPSISSRHLPTVHRRSLFTTTTSLPLLLQLPLQLPLPLPTSSKPTDNFFLFQSVTTNCRHSHVTTLLERSRLWFRVREPIHVSSTFFLDEKEKLSLSSLVKELPTHFSF